VKKLKKKKFSTFTTERIDFRTGKTIEKLSVDVARDLKVGTDIQKALRTSAHTLGWYMQLKEMAHAKMKHAKYRAHLVAEEKYDEIKLANPRMSETYVKNKIHLSPAWRKCIRRYMKWRDRYRMLSEFCVALKERNDNLRTLESSERKEREGAYV